MEDRGIQVLCNALKSRFLATKRKSYLSTDLITGDDISVEYTTLTLSKPCKSVDVYYTYDAIRHYNAVILAHETYKKEYAFFIDDCFLQIERYVLGWDTGKIVSVEDIAKLNYFIQLRKAKLAQMYEKVCQECNKFQEMNVPDIDMVDRLHLQMYGGSTNKLDYRRVHNALFKKRQIRTKDTEKFLNRDDAVISPAIDLIQMLTKAWDKIGKGDDYDEWRQRQKDLLQALKEFADTVELDIDLNLKFYDLSRTALCFKIYPI